MGQAGLIRIQYPAIDAATTMTRIAIATTGARLSTPIASMLTPGDEVLL